MVTIVAIIFMDCYTTFWLECTHIMHSNAYQFSKFETFSCNLHMNFTINLGNDPNLKIMSHENLTIITTTFFSISLAFPLSSFHTPNSFIFSLISLVYHSGHTIPHYVKWNIFANCNIAIMVSDNDNANWILLCRSIALFLSHSVFFAQSLYSEYSQTANDTIVDCGFNHI